MMSKRKSISSIQEGIRHELVFASHASLVNLMLSIVYPRSISLFCQLGCTVTSPLEVRCIEHIAMAEHNPEKIIKAIDATDKEPKNTALLRNIEAKTGDRRHLEQATSTP